MFWEKNKTRKWFSLVFYSLNKHSKLICKSITKLEIVAFFFFESVFSDPNVLSDGGGPLKGHWKVLESFKVKMHLKFVLMLMVPFLLHTDHRIRLHYEGL